MWARERRKEIRDELEQINHVVINEEMEVEFFSGVTVSKFEYNEAADTFHTENFSEVYRSKEFLLNLKQYDFDKAKKIWHRNLMKQCRIKIIQQRTIKNTLVAIVESDTIVFHKNHVVWNEMSMTYDEYTKRRLAGLWTKIKQ